MKTTVSEATLEKLNGMFDACHERLYAWQVPVRLTHWLIALSILALSVTGFYMGRPFVEVPGEAGGHFVMGWVKAFHFYAAIVFTLSVLSRILWMFMGNDLARWHQFLPVARQRRREMWHVLRFYLFADPEVPVNPGGHNALAGLTYTVVFLLYLMMIGSGLALYSMSAHVDSWMSGFGFLLPLFGGPQTARWLHHVGMWLLWGFIVHHVYSAWMVSIVEKNATVDAIFTGFKFRKFGSEER